MNRRLTVLVQAYACNPYQGSEEGVGWGWVRAISAHHDLHVLTAEYHREDIESRLLEEPELKTRITFHYVPSRRCHYSPTPIWMRIEHSILKPIMNFAYRIWQWDAYRLALQLLKETQIDLVHVITYVGFRFPGSFWKLPVPLVWGPVGGLENTPWHYLPALGWRGALMFAGRNILNSADKLFLRGPVHAFRKGNGAVIAATSAIQREIRERYSIECTVRCEIGIEPVEDSGSPSIRRADEPLQIVWSGLHIPSKALPLLFDALVMLPSELDWRLTVLGAGPQTDHWRKMASSKDLNNRIRWTGRISRDKAVNCVKSSHLMVVTSLYDLTSTVVVEALSVGVPVICPDHYGFRDAVDDTCGIKVPVDSISKIKEGLADGIAALHADESERRELSIGAKRKAATYAWSETSNMVSKLYERQVA